MDISPEFHYMVRDTLSLDEVHLLPDVLLPESYIDPAAYYTYIEFDFELGCYIQWDHTGHVVDTYGDHTTGRRCPECHGRQCRYDY